MQDPLEIVKEIISSFLQDSKDGKKRLLEWFLNNVMEEEARIQTSSLSYERSEERKGYRTGSGTRTLKTTNVLERLNLEFKRRTKKIGAFPAEQSLLRLVVTIMMDISEEWITERNYMNM